MYRIICALLTFFFASPVFAQQPTTQPFGDWSVVCALTAEPCAAVISLVSGQDRRYWLKVGVQRNQEKHLMVIIFPNLMRPSSILLKGDVSIENSFVFVTGCDDTQCRAGAVLDEKDLKMVLSNHTLTIQFATAPGEDMGWPVPMNGLKDAISHLK